MRGFEVCKGFEGKDINLPKRGTARSAGYDLEVCSDITIEPNKVVLAPTGCKAYMGNDEVLKIFARSSIAVKRGLNLPNSVGIIDSDYYGNESNDGHIFVALYNFSGSSITIKKGERIAQGIFEKYLIADGDVVISNERKGGFGSTSK